MKLFKYILLIALMVSVAALPSLAKEKEDLKPMVCAAIEIYDCGYDDTIEISQNLFQISIRNAK